MDDAELCWETDTVDGLLTGPSELTYIAPRAQSGGRLRIGHFGTHVAAAEVAESRIDGVWSVDTRLGRLGAVRWGEGSAVALMRQPEGEGAELRYRNVMSWRPRVIEERAIEVRVYDRWPYAPAGACTPRVEQIVPTSTRLWFVRNVHCPEDPEVEAPHRGRLHGFSTDGADVTPAEGIPVAQVFYGSSFSPTLQAWSDDGLAYVVRDEGSSGVSEPDALHWERRDRNGVLVARSGPLVSGAEIQGTLNVWMEVVDDAAYVYAHLAGAVEGVTSYLARIDADGRVRWSHRFVGLEGNNADWRSRVEVFEGGMVALLARPDFSSRSMVRISAEGVVTIEPGRLVVGTEPSSGLAMTADTWGVTVLVQQVDPEAPTILRRYDWNGSLYWESVLEGTRSNGFLEFLRADGRGGAYLVIFSGLYQHFDAFGRPAAFDRQISCVSQPYRYEIVPIARPAMDAGVDAAVLRRDASFDLDAGAPEADASLEFDAGAAIVDGSRG